VQSLFLHQALLLRAHECARAAWLHRWFTEKDIVSTKSRTRSKTRLSRALGIALTPKAAKYLEKRPYAPGEHGRTKRKQDSDYAVRLREKQRLRAQYGIREAQLKIQFEEARKAAGLTGENLVEQLEMRLDAIIVRSAIARTTAQARQMVVHRHILVDGKIVDRPSFRVKPGQLVHVKESSEGMEIFQVAASGGHVDVLPKTPSYLEVELDKLQARLVRRPKRAEVPVTCEVQLVVEYYAAR
jgi:small subunit ribosomal protein S4